MKKLVVVLAFSLASITYAQESKAISIFELDGVQSMSITGQGPGQDAAINPFMEEDSIAIVRNLGTNEFSVRIKNKNGKVTTTTIPKKKTIEFNLPQGAILYLDSEKKGKADIRFKKAK